MADLVVITNVLGTLSTNSYIVYNTESREALLFDPPSNSDFILKMLTQQSLKLQAILLTHGHVDHMGAAAEVRRALSGIQVYAAGEEQELLSDTGMNLSAMLDMPKTLEADVLLADGQKLQFLGREISCLLVPGHTKGGMCYYFPEDKIVFSGDTLFAGSVGRSDFPTGSASTLIRSIEEKLFTLPEDTKVYTGHGPETTIGIEKRENPFFGSGFAL